MDENSANSIGKNMPLNPLHKYLSKLCLVEARRSVKGDLKQLNKKLLQGKILTVFSYLYIINENALRRSI